MTLYEAVFKRRSVRRYKKEPLPPEFFKNLRKFELGLQPLNSAIPYSVEIIDALSGSEEIRSTDYTVSSLNVWNGVAYVSDADAQILDKMLESVHLYWVEPGSWREAIREIPLLAPEDLPVHTVARVLPEPEEAPEDDATEDSADAEAEETRPSENAPAE